MAISFDPALGAPGPDVRVGRLGLTEPPLVNAGPAGAAPFLLDGEKIAVTGVEARGDHAFWLGSLLVAEGLATDVGSGANVVAAPAAIRRELVGPRGTVIETTFVTPTLPLAAVQWSAPVGGSWSGRMEVAITLLPDRRTLRHHARGGIVRCASDEKGGVTAELRVHPEPVALEISEPRDGGMHVRVSVDGPAPVTLLLAAGTLEASSRAMAAGAHLDSYEARAASDADPGTLDTLVTATGVREVDHSVVWATLRLRSAFARGADAPAADVFWSGLGALAVGDPATAALAVETLRRKGAGPAPRILGVPASPEALATILAARLTLLSGDPAPARRALAELDPSALRERRSAEPDSWALWCHALNALADALRFGASDEEIEGLRETATLSHRRRGIGRPPLVGDPDPAGAPALLGRLLGTSEGPPPSMSVSEGTPLEAWARWAADDPAGAWTVWRAQAGLGLASGEAGRGSWDVPGRPPGLASGAGVLLCGLAHGLLGLIPDAPSGRIRVAPALPAHLAAFEARGIRVGDARVGFRFHRRGETYRFEVEQTRGRVPMMAVLEPSVPAGRVVETRVDGARADLETRSVGSRTRVPVLLPLDAPRRLEVDARG